MNDPRNTEEKEAMAGANGASAVSLDRLIKNSDAAMLFRKFMKLHQAKADAQHQSEWKRIMNQTYFNHQLQKLFDDGQKYGF